MDAGHVAPGGSRPYQHGTEIAAASEPYTQTLLALGEAGDREGQSRADMWQVVGHAVGVHEQERRAAWVHSVQGDAWGASIGR
jgi:hypothetical protein